MIKILQKVFDYNVENSVVNTFRLKRSRIFIRSIKHTFGDMPVSILDIGGTYNFWKNLGDLRGQSLNITLVNLKESNIPENVVGFHAKVADVRDEKFDFSSTDVLFSNSVIEHLGSKRAMQKFAMTIRASGKPYCIQTPSLWFPLEPHCRILFFQFFPRWFRAFLIRNFSINYFPKATTYRECLDVSDSTILLSKKELKCLFPESTIMVERFLGIPKSYSAYFNLNV